MNGKLRRKRAYSLSHHNEDYNGDRGSCKARYQQSAVEVYARFLAVDQVIFPLFTLLSILNFTKQSTAGFRSR